MKPELLDKCKNDVAELFDYLLTMQQDGLCVFTYTVIPCKFSELGEGHFSKVFLHKESGYAVKLGGFKDGIDGYPDYVNICKFLPNNVYTPTIHEYIEIDEYYYCITDRYNEVSGSDADRVIQAVEDACQIKFTNNPYDFEEVLNALYDTDGDLDIQCRNIMQDINGQLIITDPYSFC